MQSNEFCGGKPRIAMHGSKGEHIFDQCEDIPDQESDRQKHLLTTSPAQAVFLHASHGIAFSAHPRQHSEFHQRSSTHTEAPTRRRGVPI